MDATLIVKDKETRDGYIREVVVWQLNKPVAGCRHNFKYRFFFGTEDGTCLVRYDNERGKGDHKHIGATECQYIFRSLSAVFSDFRADIETIMSERGTS